MNENIQADWQDWRNWCRLCGSFDAALRLESEFEKIVYQITNADILEMSVCLECAAFLNAYNEFSSRSKQIQQMYDELFEFKESTSANNINSIRARYDLELGTVKEEDDENFSNVNIIIKAEENEIKNVVQETEEEVMLEEEISSEDFILEEHLEEGQEDEEMDDKLYKGSRRIYKKKSLEQTDVEKLYQFKCHLCNEEFPKMLPLSVHCRTVHECLPQVECICGKRLSSWKRLMDHKTRHIKDENSFSCTQCNLHYKTWTAYQKHIEKKHGENAEKFICTQCGRSFKEKQILKNHERVHLPDDLKLKHPCSYCEKRFVNSHCLKIHIARIHEKVAYFFCEICGKGCTTKSDLLWHMDKHTQERNFTCDICSLKFKSNNSLRIHKRRHLAVDATKKCPICGKEFRSSAALSNHKLVHSDEKRYKCMYCPNSYKRLESYKCHLSTHTGDRPFKCLWCNKTFINSANCRKHKLKDHPQEVEAYEALHGKKGVSLAVKS